MYKLLVYSMDGKVLLEESIKEYHFNYDKDVAYSGGISTINGRVRVLTDRDKTIVFNSSMNWIIREE